MGRYKLFCPGCNTSFDDNFTNFCPRCGTSGPLIKVDYEEKQLKPLSISGFWKFLPWLPCENFNEKFTSGTTVYKSTGLADELGLKNLFIAFNGYWPEKNANMVTCTFKELEAPPTFQRATEKCITNLIIASAGNTAKAFIYAAQHYDISLFVVVPYSCKGRLVLPFEKSKNVTIIATNKGSDYSDTIAFANRMGKELNIVNEGGARNIARRDGMGTVMLESVYCMKRLPDHYFQAVGSGTGAIAAWEAAERLIADGRCKGKLPKLHLAQNQPFTPMVDAWNKGSKEIKKMSEIHQREAINRIFATVLSNRHPPYSMGGGIYDVLTASSGFMYGCSNDEAISAGKLFEASEGIDPVPAACVAVACLIQAVGKGNIKSEDWILLNITGGGKTRLWEDFENIKMEPDIVCDNEIEMQSLKKSLEALRE